MNFKKRVVLGCLCWSALAGQVGSSSGSYSLRYLQPGSLAAADTAGNLFTLSTLDHSISLIRVSKTGPDGTPLAHIDFDASAGHPGIYDTTIVSGIAVDKAGNLIVAGATYSPYFPIVSTYMSSHLPAGFIVKLDANLKGFLFAKTLGGSHAVSLPFYAGNLGTLVKAVAVDAADNIYVAGSTNDVDFPVTPDAFQTVGPGGNVFAASGFGFLTEFSPAGQLVYSTYFGGSQTDCSGPADCTGIFADTEAHAVVVNAGGEVAIAGSTNSRNLPVTPGTFGQECRCTHAIPVGFVAKILRRSGKPPWATYVVPGIPGIPYRTDLTILSAAEDSAGNVIIGGTTLDGLVVTKGALQTNFPGGQTLPSLAPHAGFVSKIDAEGHDYTFSTYFGRNTFSVPNGVTALAVDQSDNIWATGASVPGELPLAAAVPSLGSTYIAGLSPDGGGLIDLATVPAGGAGQSIAITPTGMVAVVGPSGSLLVRSSTPGPWIAGIANLAGSTVSGAIAPYELISIYGPGIGSAAQVLFDGTPADILYAGPDRIIAIVPGLVADSGAISIAGPGFSVQGPKMSVRKAEPEVFRHFDAGAFSGRTALALNQDGSRNSAANPAAPQSIVSVWMTGVGALGPALPISIEYSTLLDRASAEVLYAGDAPGLAAGVVQVNFRIPLPTGRPSLDGAMSFWAAVGTAISESFSIYVSR